MFFKQKNYTRLILLATSLLSSSFMLYSSLNNEITMYAGAAWHRFSSYEKFTLTSLGEDLAMSPQEHIQTNFQFFPYLQGSVRTNYSNYILTQFNAGGGHLSHGIASIESLITENPTFLLPNLYMSHYAANIATVDLMMGIIVPIQSLQINPIIGYVFNKETIQLNGLDVANFYSINNKWQGGYLGVEGFLQCQCFTTKIVYKAIFGNVQSLLNAVFPLPPANVPFSQSNHSRRKAAMYGFTTNFDVNYLHNQCWEFGTQGAYSTYKNHRLGNVALESSIKNFVKQATLPRIIWQQYSWLFYISYLF